MAVDSASTNAGRVKGNTTHTRDFSMLLPFIYDTSSFSDRQVQIVNADTTVSSTAVEGHEPTSTHPNSDTTDHTEGKKDDKPAGK
ncbi:hypothetical protein CDV36_002023 [Fusarium kuroshium]|uniref:Uncharacterized protein n=1 Tax=Fusarium kuroshium TaxID=2010991 RepID=A0A3M2SL71_9HYPO|nr:hypothetical protein CDV36_002023 [Fusarium kuroshium]